MKVGTKVRLKNIRTEDRHNFTDKEGIIVEIGNESKDKRRTPELPIVVDWGEFTNSYKYSDLYEL
jgi:hypothetical protein